ncbi:MAG: hypothetical protein QXI93_02120 [Candidatus Methanomethylicia archaeon]
MPILSSKKRKSLRHVSTLARYCFFDNYSAAEKLLMEVSNEINVDGDWGRGVMLAVKGMISVGREGDPASFYLRCKGSSGEDLKILREGVLRDLSRDNITIFESGFLNAWLKIIDTFIEIFRERNKK